jgi:hypothetical protein
METEMKTPKPLIMKTRILIPVVLLAITLSSFKPRVWTTENVPVYTKAVEGLFGEEDCAPGVIWYLLRNGQDLKEQPPYVFYFCPDHSIVAVGNGQEIPGTWMKDADNNTVTIDIKGPHYIFELVSGTWNIIEHSENALELQAFVNGENRQLRIQRIQR